jgi:hypothetical protein
LRAAQSPVACVRWVRYGISQLWSAAYNATHDGTAEGGKWNSDW